jgi:hypothetical protein
VSGPWEALGGPERLVRGGGTNDPEVAQFICVFRLSDWLIDSNTKLENSEDACLA